MSKALSSGPKRKKLLDAILNAYPEKYQLEIFVDFELEEKLDAIAGGENYTEVVYKLMNWAQSQGRIEELIEKLREKNKDNIELLQLGGIG